MRIGSTGCRYRPAISFQRLPFVTNAKTLFVTYSNTVEKLRDAVTDVNNQRILSRALGQENEELKSKFEELQRSVVSRALYHLVLGLH